MGFAIAVSSSIAAFVVISLTARGRDLLSRLFRSRGLAAQLSRAGLTALYLSRDDYRRQAKTGNLPQFLDSATQSIDIVSVSLSLTDEEGQLIELFRRKLATSPHFQISISLLDPEAAAVVGLAPPLGVDPGPLKEEIRGMLGRLSAFRDSLSPDQRNRFHIRTRTFQPMGSAVLLDATATHGRIQVETKLYRAPRIESFGFEVSSPGEFFVRNFTAWDRVLRDSVEFAQRQIGGPPADTTMRPVGDTMEADLT